MNLIFPPKCIFCSKILSPQTKTNICNECYGEIPFISDSLAKAIKLDLYPAFCDEILCTCDYTGIISEAIKRFKFNDKPSYHSALGKILAEKLKRMTNYDQFDIIVSVPLSKKRFRERGYNQSQLLAASLSRATGIPDGSSLLSRIRDTGTQSLLSKNERYVNVNNAFKVKKPELIAGKSVILVDDVLTTGNTVNECCRVLKEAGAFYIMVAVIASGRKIEG